MDEETRLIRKGATNHTLAKTVNPPIQRGSTVLLPNAASLYDDDQLTYGITGLATPHALQQALADLEGAEDVTLYPSGLAAITGALLAVLKAGDEVLVVDSAYKPTRRFCDRLLARFGVSTTYYDPALDADALMALATPRTRLIVLEAPGSLTFEMQDIPAIAQAATARGIMTLIDNTWAAGFYFKPLAHGVTLSVQALTKYVGGHSDCFMGSVATSDKAVAALLGEAMWDIGWSVSPDDAYTMLRGLRTLATRLPRHQENGLAVARWLQARPEVSRVLHPALPDDPGHAIWKRDFTGACGLFGVVLKPCAQSAAKAFLDRLELFGLGFSWGGYESLALHCDPQLKFRTIPVNLEGPLLRFHVGLESVEDLKADLERGFAALNA
ncbi:cystathionine beta-lyase [Caulobacter segnis]|uniref:Cystathionine beta-lyase n=2 Tax=Caulobacter segnis TaxID=88688 RepID=D5VJG9_CAUST|nr:cystathionine beta-lyase [Caulobacter segnis]ADG10378.1 cystathionine beta-lyase [Caulobacter segnis ATCC 21756]AVQ02108.1 cystathionine beta-lyase [Caulobacter segnis]